MVDVTFRCPQVFIGVAKVVVFIAHTNVLKNDLDVAVSEKLSFLIIICSRISLKYFFKIKFISSIVFAVIPLLACSRISLKVSFIS